MTDPGASDAAVRELALDPCRCIALEAPAGSGKTTVLTQRLLRLLATVEEPEQVLAITFTRKAAAEMRERVWRALQGDVDRESALGRRLLELAEAVHERSRALGWGLDSSPARLRIQTIDSLNRGLASQLPIASRGAADRAIAASPQSLYALAARRTLLDAETDPGLAGDADRLFERLDNDFGRCERLVAGMLERRAQWLPALVEDARAAGEGAQARPGARLVARVGASLEAIVGERLRQALELLPAALIAEGAALAHEAARRRAQAADAKPGPWRSWLRAADPAHELDLARWKGLAQLALTQTGNWRANPTVREGFPVEEKALKSRARAWIAALAGITGTRELLAEISRLPDPALSTADAQSLESLARLLRLAASELELLFEELARVDYAYVAAAARRAVSEDGVPTDFGLQVGAHLRHILVDEFQDTSIEQAELIGALTAGWEEGDGRTLFIVGDPMQSIYQFRQAEVGLFLRASVHGLGDVKLEPARLTRNFRSAARLVAWFNDVFPPCFAPLDDPRTSAVRYRACAARTGAADGVVQLHATGAADADAEARAVAALVVRLRAQAPRQSVAILLASHSHAPPIVAALRAAGVAVSGVDLVPLAELPVVRDLEALTRALDHLGDRTAWLAVLRAPWCGLTLSEITALVEGDRFGTVWEAIHDAGRVEGLEPDARMRLERTRTALAAALERRDRLRLSAWVETTWLALGGPAACADDADLEHAAEYFARLEQWSGEPDWHGPLALGESLEALTARHSGSAAGAVEIMTIHRAKGLEFDHVLLPGLGRRLRSSPEPLLRWLELPAERRGSDLLMSVVTPASERSSTLGEYLKQLESQRAEHERVRLLYVASTRARRELHLFGDFPLAEARAAGGLAAPPNGTLLSALWPGIAAASRDIVETPECLPAATLPVRTEASLLPGAPLTRLAADWRRPPLGPPLQPGTIGVSGYEERRDEPRLGPDGVVAQALTGQLRRAAREGRLPERGPALRLMHERLARLGLAAEPLAQWAAEAERLLAQCLADERLQWIFAPSHARAEGPMTLTGLHEGRLTSVSVDRTFIDGGIRWLVDFRTDGPQPEDSGGTIETACAAALDRRIALGRGLGREPLRAGFYFPRTRDFIARP